MPRESGDDKRRRASLILQALKEAYPAAHCELNFSNPLQLLVATILSAQCTDKRVNLVTEILFKKYKTAADFAAAPPGELEHDIQPTGFFRNKAKSIRAACRAIVEEHKGEVPRTMAELIELGGVGRKTANVVLGNAFGLNEGVVVDTHVGRLARRLGFSRQADPVKIEQDLVKLVPQSDWTLCSHWLIWHGRRRCYARKPDCSGCEVLRLCPRLGVREALPTEAGSVC